MRTQQVSFLHGVLSAVQIGNGNASQVTEIPTLYAAPTEHLAHQAYCFHMSRLMYTGWMAQSFHAVDVFSTAASTHLILPACQKLLIATSVLQAPTA